MCNGNNFKTCTLFKDNQNSLQIQIFFNEVETVYSLGSKTSIHKIGGIYFIIRNFPPCLNAQLTNIHLLGLFHSIDLKKYRFNDILGHIIKDIKVLENGGIVVNNVKFRGTLAAMS